MVYQINMQCSAKYFETKKGRTCQGDFDLFCQNHAIIPLLVYKIILQHQEKEIDQSLKRKQIMVCSSPFWKKRMSEFEKFRPTK